MDSVINARVLMGDSLGIHIIFALYGVGLPVLISLLHFTALRRNDKDLLETARLWTKVALVLVIAGAASGTLIALQMFLVWPGVLQFGGKVIGLGFMLETYAFLLETIFLAFYLISWGKLKGYWHWALTIPIIIGSTGSAFLITSVDAWMNHPSGFDFIDGQIVNPHPWSAVFSVTSAIMGTHSIMSYYLITTLTVIAVYCWTILRRHKPKVGTEKTSKFIVGRLTILALIFLTGVAILGDISGKYLAIYEPTKLAAIELLDKTTAGAALNIGGTINPDGSAKGGINIPGVLSFLATGNFNGVVQGLAETPKEQWPPLVIHYLFEAKLLLIGLGSFILLGFAILLWRWQKIAYSKPVLLTMIGTPFVFIAIMELGWMVTEIGRQPYAVWGYVLTKDALTTSHTTLSLGWVIPSLFIVLLALTLLGVNLTIRRYRTNSKDQY